MACQASNPASKTDAGKAIGDANASLWKSGVVSSGKLYSLAEVGGGRLNAAKCHGLRGLRLDANSMFAACGTPGKTTAKPVTGNAECIAMHSGHVSSPVPSEFAMCAAI